jgi:hypothetical protein
MSGQPTQTCKRAREETTVAQRSGSLLVPLGPILMAALMKAESRLATRPLLETPSACNKTTQR